MKYFRNTWNESNESVQILPEKFEYLLIIIVCKALTHIHWIKWIQILYSLFWRISLRKWIHTLIKLEYWIGNWLALYYLNILPVKRRKYGFYYSFHSKRELLLPFKPYLFARLFYTTWIIDNSPKLSHNGKTADRMIYSIFIWCIGLVIDGHGITSNEYQVWKHMN